MNHDIDNFHIDPQDIQNFLLLNPPLTEYSEYAYQQQPDMVPKRRLSISNGQIGQIQMMVNDYYAPSVSISPAQQAGAGGSSDGNDLLDPLPVLAAGHGGRSNTVAPHSHSHSHSNSNSNSNSQSTVPIQVDSNGVPTRPLIFQNQVIFDPNNPIPGTTAWKKQRVLERNRIAASKCRLKKRERERKEKDELERLRRLEIVHLKLKRSIKGNQMLDKRDALLKLIPDAELVDWLLSEERYED